ncbi:MAG: serine/threonine protein kinase [Actinomycetota bacterium]|nr:serine/threonine protein kinase [Actinomycetota bacterium]MDQ6945656.1 serine/threonine protein kinase [Actinomycetota bacterium]
MSVPECLVGRYELRGLLGRGGMGDVRDGWDSRLNRPVAVKLLRSELASLPDARRRFEAEAHAAATLIHPNVVAVFDSGEDAGVPFIVMERLPGRTLGDEIAKGPMVEDRVRSVLVEVVEALVAAHDAEILHRDIKPGNVLFSSGDSVKVADFGIAKTADTDQTATGMIVGTLAYLSPERLTGNPATAADDLYAVGVVGYEALCGHKPFVEENPLALVWSICEKGVPSLAGERPGVDPALVRVIERAMAREPERRFSNARSMLDALRLEPSRTMTKQMSSPIQTVTATQILASPTEMLPSTVALPAPASPDAVDPAGGALSGRGGAALAAIAVILTIIVVVLFVDAGGHGSGSPPSSSTPTTAVAPRSPGSLPPSLGHALNDLDRAVQP